MPGLCVTSLSGTILPKKDLRSSWGLQPPFSYSSQLELGYALFAMAMFMLFGPIYKTARRLEDGGLTAAAMPRW